MKKVTVTFGELFNRLGIDTGVREDTVYEDIPEMYIDTPHGRTKIEALVKKPMQEYLSLDVEGIDKPIDVSPNHIFLEDNKNVFAKDATYIDSVRGKLKVNSKTPGLKKEPLYDISINNQNAKGNDSHIYISSNGVYHHNSFVGMKVARNAQKKGMEVLYLDTEFAFDYGFAKSVGIDTNKLLVIQDNSMETVQQTLVQTIQELELEERKDLLVIIDSWGGLVTSKTINDAVSGKDVTDMTIAKKKNSLARLLTGMGVTVFVINQTYETLNQYDPLAVGGGKGLYFASSSIVMGTSKAKNKDSDGEISGAIITATTKKSRFAKENSKLKYLINYSGGIHPTYGLLDDALEGGYVVKPTMGFYSRPVVEDDKKWRERAIWENSKEFWNPILTKTDFPDYIAKKYSFEQSVIVDEDFDIGDIKYQVDKETGEIK